jgi:GntR family transcriptional repressor for pyruvate dehydrogenase complex
MESSYHITFTERMMDMEYVPRGIRQTKSEYIADQVKKKIISGEYASGDKLPIESELCEAFGVSRITVREAMKKLSTMDLVEVKQGKGTFVRSVDLGVLMKPLFQLVEFSEMNIDAIYTAREYIEGGIAVLAARNRTEEDLSMLKTHLENIQYCSQQGDLEGCYQCDVAFHMTLAKAARNPILLAAMEALQDIDDACVKRYDKYLVGYDDSRKEHGDILDAVEKQDFVKAQEAMAAHAKNSKIILLG